MVKEIYPVDLEKRAAYICFEIATNCQGLAYQAAEEWEIRHHCTTGIIFVAFAIEAMINHFGQIMFEDEWEKERISRKEQHKKLFKAVNLPDYLGRKSYQIADRCFKIRDIFAHGKTNNETVNLTVSPNISFEELSIKTLFEPTSMENLATIENLDEYIEAARQIEEDIQEYGYYPKQNNIPQEEREKLIECPLEGMGIRSFELRCQNGGRLD